ncbi:MAG: 6-bladed beta-propeller [Thermodesulfovibrionales bacterium]
MKSRPFFKPGRLKEKRLQSLCLAAILCSLLLMSGCASKWNLRTESTDLIPQWPQHPTSPKVIYLRSITGFDEAGVSVQSLVKSIAFGTPPPNNIQRPSSVTAGKDGRVAISDAGCECVHLFIPSEQRYLRLIGSPAAEFTSPVGVAFDETLRLYVSDSVSGEVHVFDRTGEFSFTFGRDYKPPLKRPTGLAYNYRDRLLYIADTLENKIYAADEKGGMVFSIGQRGSEKGQFNFPAHIFWAPSGLYVVDTMNFRVQVFDSSGVFLSSFGRHGNGSGDFAMPKGIALDSDGIIYVADNLFDNIQLFGRDGTFLLTVGMRGYDHGEFWMPSGIFADSGGLLYVCDTYNSRIQVFRIISNYGAIQ